ncbi:MAG: hypothetical protein ACRD36_07580 [Candidatus Acidiferrum sp.]
MIARSHRLWLADHKSNVIPPKRDEENQKAFIASYDKLLHSLAAGEAVVVADAGRSQLTPRGPAAGAAPREARDPADERALAHRHSQRGPTSKPGRPA